MISKYFEAFEFASRSHRKQFRKINGTPYIAHPMAVAFVLEKMGQSDDLVIAAVLHDVLEDTDANEDELAKIFGQNVLDYVKSVTENKSIINWHERKQDYITRIKTSSSDVKMLSLADKLHNLFTMQGDKATIGDELWTKFNAPKNQQQWYYETLLQVFRDDESLSKTTLINEMKDLIDLVFAG